MKTLIVGDSRRDRGSSVVDEVNESHNCFSLEMLRDGDRENECMSNLQNVTMLPLSNPILSRRVKTQLLRKSAMRRK